MVETVVALLMFINGEIKEHRIQDNMATCLRGKRVAERTTTRVLVINVLNQKQKQKYTWVRKSIRKIILD